MGERSSINVCMCVCISNLKNKLFIAPGVMGKFENFLFSANFVVAFKVNVLLHFNTSFVRVQEVVFPINLKEEGKPLFKAIS